jgi:hypothetical protein
MIAARSVLRNYECAAKFVSLPEQLGGQVVLSDLHLRREHTMAGANGSHGNGAVRRSELDIPRLGRLISEGDLKFLIATDGQTSQKNQTDGAELVNRTHAVSPIQPIAH